MNMNGEEVGKAMNKGGGQKAMDWKMAVETNRPGEIRERKGADTVMQRNTPARKDEHGIEWLRKMVRIR